MVTGCLQRLIITMAKTSSMISKKGEQGEKFLVVLLKNKEATFLNISSLQLSHSPFPELITVGEGWTLLNDLNKSGPTFGVEPKFTDFTQ